MKETIFERFNRIANERKNNTAIYYQDEKISYAKLLKIVYRISYCLNELNIKKGDTVLLIAPNIPESVATFLACSQLNVNIFLLHPLTKPEIIKQEYTNKKAKLLITVSLFIKDYQEIIESKIPLLILSPVSSLPIYKKIVFNHINKTDLKAYNLLDKSFKYDNYKNMYTKIEHYQNDNGRIFLSSGGTTSEPKTIILSDYALISLIDCAPDILNTTPDKIVNKTMLAALPMFHGFGLVMGVLAILLFGGKINLLPKFKTSIVIKALKKNQLNMLIGVPVMFEALLNNKNFNGKMLQNIEVCFVGGDFISPSLLERFNTKLKENCSKGKLFEGYGLTETVTVLCVNTFKDNKEKSIGKPLKNIDVKIVDENQHEIKNNEIGEIAISSPTLMNGYFEKDNPFILINEKKYVLSGDLGYKDDDGFLYFISRKKRIIKKKGFNIYPLLLEKSISKIEHVKECAYLSKFNDKEEVTYLFINSDFEDKEELKRIIKEHILKEFPSYNVPDFIIYRDNFKKTNVGKIDYNSLIKSLD